MFVVACREVVGYAKQQPCTHLVYKLDATADVYHVYCITPEELALNTRAIDPYDYLVGDDIPRENFDSGIRRLTNFFQTDGW
jgi:hypothetical protein